MAAQARAWLPALLAIALLEGACATNPFTGEREVSKTGKGAAVGAVVGGIAGAVTGDEGRERAKRALIGAGVGALAGAAVGAYKDRQEARLRAELAGTGVSVTRAGDQLILNMPGHVTFATDSADISASFYPVLRSVALVLEEYRKTVIEVAGHTDSTGTLQHNQTLSERRAESVAAFLGAQGIEQLRLLMRGFGPNRPVANNDTREGRQANRRVELILVPLTA
jgi:outer membrane protein OmpA-like peptidoglycan-associated protein